MTSSRDRSTASRRPDAEPARLEGRRDPAELRELGRSEPGLQTTAPAPPATTRPPHGHAVDASGHGGGLESLGVHQESGVEPLDWPAAHRQNRGRQQPPSAPSFSPPRPIALEREWIVPEDDTGVGDPDGRGVSRNGTVIPVRVAAALVRAEASSRPMATGSRHVPLRSAETIAWPAM